MAGQQFLWASFSWKWDAVRAKDGSVLMSRGPRWLHSYGAAWAGIAFAWTCASSLPFFFWQPSTATTVHDGFPADKILPLELLGLGLDVFLWSMAIRILFGHEEWQARPGLIAMQKQLFGVPQTQQFKDGKLIIRPYDDDEGPRWRLSVKALGATRSIAIIVGPDHWSETELGILAKALGEATGFPLEDEDGTVHRFGNRVTTGAVGATVAVRRLHTGLVLEQVPGSTLAGASLAAAQLDAADLEGADLRGANLRGADLRGSSLRGAILTGASMQNSLLTAADLMAADLTAADLTGAKLIGATYDTTTCWPAGFDPVKHGAVLVK